MRKFPVLLIPLVLLGGCISVEQAGVTCGEGTVLRGKRCVAVDVSAEPVRYTDAQLRQMVIEGSIKSYAGACACPYSRAPDGSICEARSAYSRGAGDAPLCYESDVSDVLVEEVRRSL